MAAFRTPPEVLLRTALRAALQKQLPTALPVPRACHNAAQRFYHAAACTKIGKPLEVKEMPMPDPIPAGKVLIATHAAGINFADILISQGKYQERPKTPFILGAELSGQVEAVGEGVEGWKKGDRVVALPVERAAFAEYCLADDFMVFPVPDGLSLVDAGAMLVSYGTAMMALVRTAQLKEGETVLVTAAAGATGLAAVDIALNLFKANVIGVCGGEEKCQLLRQRGVQHTINYYTENIREKVKAITNGRGVNVVMDQVGGDTFNDCLKSIAFEGRLITVGYASGSIPNVPINKLLLRSCSVRGVFWGSYGARQPKAFADSIHRTLEACKQGKLHPYTGKSFPLSQVNEAFAYIMNRQSTGKVVLKMREE